MLSQHLRAGKMRIKTRVPPGTAPFFHSPRAGFRHRQFGFICPYCWHDVSLVRGNIRNCVFSTKDRKNSIPVELQPKLWAYLIGIAKNLQITMIAVGGMPNHIHLLIAVPPAMALSVAIQKLKANSSRWMGEQGLAFEWQKRIRGL